MIGREATPRRRSGAHARRPAPPLRRRVGRIVPAAGRILALVAFAGLVAGLVLLVNGPWLRVRETVWAGERYTPDGRIDEILGSVRGAPLLALDTTALAARLEQLPAVAEASIAARLPGRVEATLIEKEAAVVWRTSAVQLVCAADGSAIGQLALSATLPDDLAALPLVDDRRQESRNIIVGDRVDEAVLLSAVHLAAVDPGAMGSTADRLIVRLDEDSGFQLVSHGPDWRAVFGLYEPDLIADPALLDQRIAAQVAAVRTLFGEQTEEGVSWVDARNPGRVYWRP